MDGGEGCSENVIHGTNLDLGEPPADTKQQGEMEAQGEETTEDTAEGGEGEKKGGGEEGNEPGQQEKEHQSIESAQEPDSNEKQAKL